MAKYLYLFRGGEENMASASPEEHQEHMQKWGAWMQALAAQVKLIDGLPLNKAGKVVEKAGDVIHDGPFTEGTEVLFGQNGSRDEYGNLPAVVDALECRPHGDFGLAIADVAADQTVHRTSPFHVGLEVIDGVQLIRGFDIWKRRAEFLLQM